MTVDKLMELVDQLQVPSDNEIASEIKKQIREWSVPPKSDEVLATINDCVFGALASGFAIRVMHMIHATCLRMEAGEADPKLSDPKTATLMDEYEVRTNNVTYLGDSRVANINQIAT